MANSYGKRPLWQWVLIYLVVGGVIYALLYYFVFAKNGGYGSSYSNSSTPISTSGPETQQTPTQPSTQQTPPKPGYPY